MPPALSARHRVVANIRRRQIKVLSRKQLTPDVTKFNRIYERQLKYRITNISIDDLERWPLLPGAPLPRGAEPDI